MSTNLPSIHFPQGIPGFQDLRDFVIVSQGEESPFFLMQSVEKSEVSFALVNPFEVYLNYDIDLPESTLESLEIKEDKDVIIYTMVTLRDPVQESTANLVAPIVVNRSTQRGVQTVLTADKLSVRERLFAPVIAEEAK
jgi:flagellar assembly factor FliW